jgi:hypothetical protein
MRNLCRAIARGTQSDERTLTYSFLAVGTSVVALTLFHFIA